MTSRSRIARALVALTILVSWATGARADRQSESIALGFQTERADVVLVGVRDADAGDDAHDDSSPVELRYDVEHVIRGDVDGATRLLVAVAPDVARRSAAAADRQLLFLRRDEGGGLRLVAGAVSVRPLPDDGPLARLPGFVERYAAALDLPAGDREEALRDVLVAQVEDDDPGIAWSGATDLHRHSELLAGLSQSQSARIVTAFRASDATGRTREMLAMAVAICGDPGAVDALADAVDANDALAIKGGLGDAAQALGGSALAAELATRLADAPASHRVALVSVLGRVGRADAVTALLPHSSSADTALRQEALHACGRVARNVRRDARRARAAGERPPEPVRPDALREPPVPSEAGPPLEPPQPETRPEADWATVREQLRLALARCALGARTSNDKRASLWALAQLDDPAAYSFLRRLAGDSPDEDVRRYAKSYLRRPAQSLILR